MVSKENAVNSALSFVKFRSCSRLPRQTSNWKKVNPIVQNIQYVIC